MAATDENSLNIDQLAQRVAMTVRTVRFYAGRGLIPPPRREGRNGFYGPDHIARLELVRDLQAHGFTLAAIEHYLAQIPEDATPSDVAMRRTLLAPWQPELPEKVTREELEQRSGRTLADDDLELLVALGVVEPLPDGEHFGLAPAHLAVGIALLDLGMPLEAAHESRRLITAHTRELAGQLNELFRTQIWPHLLATGWTESTIKAVEQLKPITVSALVTGYEQAVDEIKRHSVRRHS